MRAALKKLGSGGVIAVDDFPAEDLPAHFFTDADCAGFRDGKLLKLPGFLKRVFDFTEDVFWFQGWDDGAGVQTVAFGASAAIYTTTEGQYVRASTIAGTALGASEEWQSDVFGSFCVMNNTVQTPKYSSSYNAGTDVWTFSDLPGWGAATSPSGACQFVRSYANHLIAGGLDNAPFTVYLSDQGSPETFPASWDYGDPTLLAREIPLQSKDGPIIDGGILGDRFIVYQRNAATAFELTGDAFVVSARRLPYNAGIVARDAWVEFEGRHLVVGENGIAIHDGFNIVRPDDNKIRYRFFGEVYDLSKVKVTRDDLNHEVVIYYPTGDHPADRKLLYNWLEGTWTFETIGEQVVRIAPAIVPAEPMTWDDLSMSWDDLTMSWTELDRTERSMRMYQLSLRSLEKIDEGYVKEIGDVAFALEIAPDRILIEGAAGTGDRLLFETGEQVDYDAWASRGSVDLDDLLDETVQSKAISGAYLNLRGSGLIDVQVGASDSPHGTVDWDQRITVDMDAEVYFADVRARGRFLHWRVGSWGNTAHAGRWELSGVTLQLDLEGAR